MSSLCNARTRGVTLIEILIAFFMLCIAALGASGLISYGHRGTRADFRQGEALQLLVDRLNYLSSLSFDVLKNSIDSGKADLSGDFNDVPFGDIVVGANKYRVRGRLEYQSVTFDKLKQLRFPNPEYRPNDPRTWIFADRPTDSETFDRASGDFAYAVIKVTVTVQPIEDRQGTRTEREIGAMTFVCDTENRR